MRHAHIHPAPRHAPLPAEPPKISFEFFPPKTEAAEAQLWATIDALKPLKPRFVSVTYGAGGSTRETTFDTVKRLAHHAGLAAEKKADGEENTGHRRQK